MNAVAAAASQRGLAEDVRKLWIFAMGDVVPQRHVHRGAKTGGDTRAAGDYLSAQRNANPDLCKD